MIKKKHPENPSGLVMPDGTPLTAAQPKEEKPKHEVKPELSTPLDKICRAISGDAALLKKVEADLEALKKAVKEREEFLDLLQRTQADFSNYQKRIKREKECWEKYQDEPILKELLPALESLNKPLEIKCESADAKCIQEGIDLARRELLRILEKRGIILMKTIGEKFNPAQHEAVATIESDKHPEGIILEEVRPGFILHDRVIRPAQVKVSKSPAKPDANDTNSKPQ
jgi:molecular chaperone GrpE